MPRRLKYRADTASDFQNSNMNVSAVVKEVINTIRANGDIAVRKYSEKFDKWSPQSFKLSRAQIDSAIAVCPEQTIKDIKEVQANVRKFAEAQRKSILDFELEIQPGVHLGQKNLPINTVGA
jgi:histidinol dehydrogenase